MTLSQISKIIRIFCYYAADIHRDKHYFDKLMMHLSELKRQSRVIECIIEWYDSAISAGSNWRQIIHEHVNDADIIVLLISADFLASKYYHEAEMNRIFERYEEGTVRVLAVILRPTDWINHPLGMSGLLPKDGKAISLWKNKDLAFLEVVRGIRKVVEELVGQVASALPRSGSPKFPLWTVTHRRNRFFTGREDILMVLHTYFFANHLTHTCIQALNGMDGIGKTQLAIEYSYLYKHEYQAVFWVRADSRDLFNADIRALAELLLLPDSSQETLLFAAVRNWLEHNHSWLFLLDNIEDYSLIDLIIPVHSIGHVLLTTHSHAIGTHAHAITVAPMTIDDGALFLLRRATIIAEQALKDAASPDSYIQACAIACEFDGFTLALDQAGAYIEETQSTLAAYLALYLQRQSQLLQLRGQFSNNQQKSVTATLTLAFDRIEQINPPAMELLRLLAFLHPDAIPDEMLTPDALEQNTVLQTLMTDPLVLDAAIATLLSFSLVRRRADTTMLSIHRIVQVVLRAKLSLEEQRQWAICTVRLVNSVFPDAEDFTTWPVCYRYLPQAQMCAEYITQWHLALEEAVQLLYRLGRYCYARALYSDAEVYLTAVLMIREQAEEPEKLATAQSLNALALLYRQQGKYHQSEDVQRRSLVLYEQLLGSDHPETAIILNNLALLYQEQDKLSLVEPLYQRILAIYQQTYGLHHAETATTLNNLALLYQEQGQLSLVEPLYLRALAIREEVLQSGDPDLAQSLNNLATFYLEQERYAQAEPLLLRALQIREQTLGTEHPDTALNLNNLAYCYRLQEKYQQAENLYQRAIAIFERVSGSSHPDTALSLNNLGKLYYVQGNYQQAEPLYLRALTIYEQTFGSEYPDTAFSRGYLAELYARQGRQQEAESFYQRALSIDPKNVGTEHPDIALIMKKYALFLEETGRFEEAKVFGQAALRIDERYTNVPPDQII